jgi:hypothetical protein
MVFFFILLILPSWADRQIESLCFPSRAESSKAAQDLAFILVKGVDSIQQDDACLNIAFDSTRRELFNKWIRQKYPNAQTTFSSEPTEVKRCEIKVKKISQKIETTNTAKVRKSFSVSQSSGNTTQTEVQKLVVSSGNHASLFVDQTLLKIYCQYKSRDNYQLKFEMVFVPRVPPPIIAPPGTIVIAPTPPPPDQSGTSISTEIDITRGQVVNIGQIAKDLNSKNHSISNQSGQIGVTSGSDVTTWLLSIL